MNDDGDELYRPRDVGLPQAESAVRVRRTLDKLTRTIALAHFETGSEFEVRKGLAVLANCSMKDLIVDWSATRKLNERGDECSDSI